MKNHVQYTTHQTWTHVLLVYKEQHIHALKTKQNKTQQSCFEITKTSYIQQNIKTLHAYECKQFNGLSQEDNTNMTTMHL